MRIALFFLVLFSAQANFPEHWWKPISNDDLASWEIGPQTGVKGKSVVLSKRHELGILSNFANTPFKLDGKSYPGIEGFWQSLKYPEGENDERFKLTKWKYTRDQVAQMTSFEAKAAGDYASLIMKKAGIDWVTYQGKKMKYWTNEKGAHYNLIVKAMKAKLTQNSKVAKVLKSTGNLILLPDHKTKPTDPPAWKYFDIWMELRSTY